MLSECKSVIFVNNKKKKIIAVILNGDNCKATCYNFSFNFLFFDILYLNLLLKLSIRQECWNLKVSGEQAYTSESQQKV